MVIFCLKSFVVNQIADCPARRRRNPIFLQNDTKPRKSLYSNGTQIQTSFSSRPSAENLFLQKETRQEQSLCFLRYLLSKIFSDAKGRRKQRCLTLDFGPNLIPGYGLCSLRYLL
ncbi:MAG: hypothetical protein DMF07_13975 [Verrucomicrobia bacterium]|nr:MAG: hypothetical protein DMF07_13975 [Verrucomicrobiota bacterium]